MSTTPRADNAVVRCACGSYIVEPDFARQLETELAASTAEVARLTNQAENLLKPMRDAATARADHYAARAQAEEEAAR